MSLKSCIKSKKQKLNDKKFSKGNAPVIDIIESSDDDYYKSHERVQKRSKYSGKPLNYSSGDEIKSYVPKVLDLTRISSSTSEMKKMAEKVIYQSTKQLDDSDAMLVVETAEQENPQTISRDRSLFSYKVEGKEGIKYVSQMHVKGRINSEIKDIETKEIRKTQQEHAFLERIMEGSFPSSNSMNVQNGEKKNGEKQKGVQEPAQRKRAARYFEEGQSDDQGQQNVVKCFRCYKKGHIAKNCIEQQPKQICNFCLQQHHHSVCDSSPCFKCSQPGHISQDCQSTGIECRKCRKRGHKSDKCGIYMPLDYHNKDDDYVKNRFKKSDLKKLKCLTFCKNPEGHFNCFVYNSRNDVHPYAHSKPKMSEVEKIHEREKQKKIYGRYY